MTWVVTWFVLRDGPILFFVSSVTTGSAVTRVQRKPKRVLPDNGGFGAFLCVFVGHPLVSGSRKGRRRVRLPLHLDGGFSRLAVSRCLGPMSRERDHFFCFLNPTLEGPTNRLFEGQAVTVRLPR